MAVWRRRLWIGRVLREGEFLDSRPGQIDVEEEEEDSETDDGSREFIVIAFEAVE